MNKVILNLGGKEREGNLGLGFLARVEDKEGLNITDLLESFQKKPLSALPTLMYHSLAYGDERTGNKVDFTKYDVIDWIDEDGGLSSPETIKFSDAFAKSITYKTDKQNESLGKQKKPTASR
ncbi:hypothetical protein HZQ15_18680 [Elizabethkingia anophelis]|uniref:hypothetical protein n=1 Tax=Elizabethkingia TaxID=308865 RepID=UPI0021A83A7E|nr:hypothetical protein [Elizabethkingia meningoseptica]MCT3835882.1 hypothetical protein [Elizabethkingia anophelis]MCT4042828.1 hypothetical protein [Elizabethkingia anophelis]MDE5526631.1 hypothetical protein [Elizabethkingia meningoseptica]MDV3593903.1 hypothetical protein [Elizabethkingia anophelis]